MKLYFHQKNFSCHYGNFVSRYLPSREVRNMSKEKMNSTEGLRDLVREMDLQRIKKRVYKRKLESIKKNMREKIVQEEAQKKVEINKILQEQECEKSKKLSHRSHYKIQEGPPRIGRNSLRGMFSKMILN